LSAKFSTSPTLHLQIADSGICRLLHHAYLFLLLSSLVLLCVRGYPLLAVAGVILLPAFGFQLYRQPMAGATLRWAGGRWTLERNGEVVEITPDAASRLTPWVICFCWRQAGRRQQVWLFADSASARALRRLRVRLNLEGGARRDQAGSGGVRMVSRASASKPG